MRVVLYFSSGYSSKLEYMENAILREFIKRGHDVIVVTRDKHWDYPNYKETMEPQIGPQFIGAGEYNEEGIRIIRLKTYHFGRNKKFQLNPGTFGTLIKLKPDLVFFLTIENVYGAVFALLAKYFRPFSFYIVINYLPVYENNKIKQVKHKIDSFIKDYLTIIISKKVDKIISMNEYCYDSALKLVKSNEKIIPITLGADLNNIMFRSEKRQEIRSKLAINTNEVLVIHSGKIVPKKKTDILVKAFCELNYPNTKLLIIGNGSDEYLKSLKKEIPSRLTERVLFHTAVISAELHYYYSASDIAVWVDHASISTIEASAVGLPVIVPDFHGYEHRTKYNNGLKIKPGNFEDLKEKLLYLFENPTERINMGIRGRELVEKELNWKSIADNIMWDFEL